MSAEEPPLHAIEVTAAGGRLEWRCGGEAFAQPLDESRVAALTAATESLYQRLEKGHPVAAEMSELGAEMGEVLVGERNVSTLLGFLAQRGGRFSLCRVSGEAGALAALPWEALRLPGWPEPLLVAPEARGWFD
jgi:hypothetical protein